jgi:purine-binding chemotaxis protein CheW
MSLETAHPTKAAGALLPLKEMPCATVVGTTVGGPAMVEICTVRVGPNLFGIPIAHILEIVGGALPRPVPLAPEFVGGLVHYRGDVLTAVSLRRLLRMGAYDGCQDLVVLESGSGGFGLLVDSVGEVLTVSSADYEANPSVFDGDLDEARRALFSGVYKLKDSLLVMLDTERLDPMRLESVCHDLVRPDSACSERVLSGSIEQMTPGG